MAKRNRKKKKTNYFLVFLKVLLLLMLTGMLAVLGVFYFGGYYSRVKAMKDEADTFVSESTKETFVPSQTGEIYDSEGTLISETLPEKDSNYLTINQIPELFKSAIISIEDKNFYNQVANYAYLDTGVNISIGKKEPKEYFSEALTGCSGTQTVGTINDETELWANLEANCIPHEVVNMTYVDYMDFLRRRRTMMAQKIRKYYDML